MRGKDAQTCPTLGGLERNRLGIQGSGRFGQSARPWNRRNPGAFLFYFCVPVSDPAQTRRAVRDRPHYTTGQCWRNMRDNLRESSFTGSDRIGRRGAAQPTANDPSASCPPVLKTVLRKPFPPGLGPSYLECTSSRPDESTIHDCFAVPPPSLGPQSHPVAEGNPSASRPDDPLPFLVGNDKRAVVCEAVARCGLRRFRAIPLCAVGW